MRTLNVGAGRTDEEYRAAEEQRRADLRADSRNDANYFFIAAAVAALGSGLTPVQLNILANVGVIDLLQHYSGAFGELHILAVYATTALWLVLLTGLGFAAQKGYRWAFLVGIVLYVMDMGALAVMFSTWSTGVHGFFVYRWFQGQKALKELKELAHAEKQ